MALKEALGLDLLKDNVQLLSDEDKALVSSLLEVDQAHLFTSWPPLGTQDDDKKRLLGQLRLLDANYAGGLVKYIINAKQLLKESKEGTLVGTNPFEGCVPAVPEGEKLDFGSESFIELEDAGLQEAANTGFVLVAGGLGERLGYSGIKVALPAECATGTCYLQLYIESILAIQDAYAPAGKVLPLAIMTSEDTHARTIALLEDNDYFGADRSQITLLKQEKVACLADSDARLALESKDPFTIQTKPHGHGDVHMLLHSSGLARDWLTNQNLRWVVFFQDTNAQLFRALPAALGVSKARAFDFNSLAVPRKAREAIGAITRLSFPDGSSRTLNVEYNQLDPLLRATTHPQGDVNDASGFSPFPGNINQLIVRLESYCTELERHGGVIAEFVNPKYADGSRTKFKKSTRLECMMQDFPKSLPADARVGFTSINQTWAAYSPVKNDPVSAAAKAQEGDPSHSATSGEFDVYKINCKMLESIGVSVGPPSLATFNDIPDLDFWPRVLWTPSWALGFTALKEKLKNPGAITIGQDTVLLIRNPNAKISSLTLKRGAAEITGKNEGDISGAVVNNDGWTWEALNKDGDWPEELVIRGFHVVKHDMETLEL